MPHDRLDRQLSAEVGDLVQAGTAKGAEVVIEEVLSPRGGLGRRHRVAGQDAEYLVMNSNSYVGLSRHPAVIDAEERATRRYGVGPGAVRFISGTTRAHVDLEGRLAGFHSRGGATVFSSAYAAVVSTLVALATPETVVLSDELNHNCIINGLKMSRPLSREVFPHLDYEVLESKLGEASGTASRALIVTDGVFSMRGDHADLARLGEIARSHDEGYPENVVLVVDDSHGVGAYGDGGRGTEAVSGGSADVLIGTLGKAFGVNGGYVAGSADLAAYLRQKAPMYIYSNPITPGEAAAAETAVSIVDSDEGAEMLSHLAEMTSRFEQGLVAAGFETIRGPHPIVPLMVRDTESTAALVSHLFGNGILATGLNYPIVPRGDEEIRFQVSADHTPGDIDFALEVLASFDR